MHEIANELCYDRRGGGLIPRKNGLIAATDDPTHSRLFGFWSRVVSNSLIEHCSPEASAFESPLLPSTTIT